MFMICSIVNKTEIERYFAQGACAKQQHQRRRYRPEQGVRGFWIRRHRDDETDGRSATGAWVSHINRAAVCGRRRQRRFLIPWWTNSSATQRRARHASTKPVRI